MVPDCAVIFDVDGVLLDLTSEEEDVFFATFKNHLDPASLSNDWNSYKIRNDDDIVDEIMARHGIAAALKHELVQHYFALLSEHLRSGGCGAKTISGAADLLQALAGQAQLGIATANFHEAARLRLATAGLWHHVHAYAFGADGGGHKTDILGRCLVQLNLAPHRVVYVGDNLNDLAAGLDHGVQFIGFSTDAAKRQKLLRAGASTVVAKHGKTLQLITTMLDF